MTKIHTVGGEAAPIPTVRMYEGSAPAPVPAGPLPLAPPSVGSPRVGAQNVGVPDPGFAAPSTFGVRAGEPAGGEYYESIPAGGQSVPAALRTHPELSMDSHPATMGINLSISPRGLG